MSNKNFKFDLSRVPQALIEEFIRNEIFGHTSAMSDIRSRIRDAAAVPLRTKAQVDADIVDLVRAYHQWFLLSAAGSSNLNPYYNSSFHYRGKNVQVNDLLASLNDEETSD